MKKNFLLIFYILSGIVLFSNEKSSNLSFRLNDNYFYDFNTSSGTNFTFTENDLTFLAAKEKIKIFDTPDMSWIKEKNRMEKLFIGIGVASCTIGFSMFLAGLLNLVVPFDAVSVDGVAIEKVRNAYIAILATGSGLMAAGAPFIIVGSVRIGIQKKKEKAEQKKTEENINQKDEKPSK